MPTSIHKETDGTYTISGLSRVEKDILENLLGLCLPLSKLVSRAMAPAAEKLAQLVREA